jgi:hypothetical protein
MFFLQQGRTGDLSSGRGLTGALSRKQRALRRRVRVPCRFRLPRGPSAVQSRRSDHSSRGQERKSWNEISVVEDVRGHRCQEKGQPAHRGQDSLRAEGTPTGWAASERAEEAKQSGQRQERTGCDGNILVRAPDAVETGSRLGVGERDPVEDVEGLPVDLVN